MGLFDKKSRLDAEFEALEQEIEKAASVQIEDAVSVSAAEVTLAEPKNGRAAEERPSNGGAASSSNAAAAAQYGIDRAVELARHVPADASEPMLEIVRRTLESAGIEITAIIEDAIRRAVDIEKMIGAAETDIEVFESEIAARRAKITTLKGQLEEVARVRAIFTRPQSAAAPAKAAPPPPPPSNSAEDLAPPREAPRAAAPAIRPPAPPSMPKR